jgi:hypothetical protein
MSVRLSALTRRPAALYLQEDSWYVLSSLQCPLSLREGHFNELRFPYFVLLGVPTPPIGSLRAPVLVLPISVQLWGFCFTLKMEEAASSETLVDISTRLQAVTFQNQTLLAACFLLLLCLTYSQTRNICVLLPHYTASHPRWQSSSSPLWEPQIQLVVVFYFDVTQTSAVT